MTGAKFITFEGGEGSGKSTQHAMLAEAFHKAGIACAAVREPGGTQGGEEIRTLLLQGRAGRWDALSETLLFQAARIENVKRHILPALAEGDWVLCDRFLDSTLVYQGIAKGLGTEFIQSLHRLTLGNLAPDMTFLLDIEPQKGLERTQARTHAENRFEKMDITFHASLRNGFLSLAAKHPGRIHVIDAARDKDRIHSQLVAVLKDRYNLPL